MTAASNTLIRIPTIKTDHSMVINLMNIVSFEKLWLTFDSSQTVSKCQRGECTFKRVQCR